ncbi:MAG: helix-turn-helix transcriptional regulator, partial [Polyangiaceae bacterium]|nr:helix-turn-helix transcriptional regulator [Polyangiaceae bacterium]
GYRSAILRSALRKLAEQQPPRESDVVELNEIEGAVRATVVRLAASLGAKPDYVSRLFQVAGLRANAVVRWYTVLHGLVLFSEHLKWMVVARRLGFSDLSGWSHFCDRLTGAGPAELVQHRWGDILSRAVTQCVRVSK